MSQELRTLIASYRRLGKEICKKSDLIEQRLDEFDQAIANVDPYNPILRRRGQDLVYSCGFCAMRMRAEKNLINGKVGPDIFISRLKTAYESIEEIMADAEEQEFGFSNVFVGRNTVYTRCRNKQLENYFRSWD